MLQGSVLTAIEQVLQQLDLEQSERSRDAWLDRHPLPTVPIGDWLPEPIGDWLPLTKPKAGRRRGWRRSRQP